MVSIDDCGAVVSPKPRLSTGDGPYDQYRRMVGEQAYTWRPLEKINPTCLGAGEGAKLSGALSKYALSTTIMVEGRHHEEPQRSQHFVVIEKRMMSQLLSKKILTR